MVMDVGGSLGIRCNAMLGAHLSSTILHMEAVLHMSRCQSPTQGTYPPHVCSMQLKLPAGARYACLLQAANKDVREQAAFASSEAAMEHKTGMGL